MGMKACLDLRGYALDVRERGQKVQVPESAPKFPVRHHGQTRVLLHLDRLADGVVLDAAQFFRADFPVCEPRTTPQQLGWTQQAADMVGAEGAGCSRHHLKSLRCRRGMLFGRLKCSDSGPKCACVSRLLERHWRNIPAINGSNTHEKIDWAATCGENASHTALPA